MIPIQEIDFCTDKGVRIELEIRKLKESFFIIHILIDDPDFSPGCLLPIAVYEKYENPLKAFEDGVKIILCYMGKNQLYLTRVNNPCNCEFISKSDQQNVVDQHFSKNSKIIVEVNGKT